MVINDHINLHAENPLRGQHFEEWGSRFPDMSQPYDRGMLHQALEIAHQHNITCFQGVYAGEQGPNLETSAEYKFLQIIGADAVGMSTIPEVIVARQMELPVFAVSVITDMCIPPDIEPVDIPTIIAAATKAEPSLTLLIRELLARQ